MGCWVKAEDVVMGYRLYLFLKFERSGDKAVMWQKTGVDLKTIETMKCHVLNSNVKANYQMFQKPLPNLAYKKRQDQPQRTSENDCNMAAVVALKWF